jgi:hypothetical protein
MPKDAPPNGGAVPGQAQVGPFGKVSEMQAKLHRWAGADPGRRFDDLFNFVCDPATLNVAFTRVAGNRGARTPGVDSSPPLLTQAGSCVGQRRESNSASRLGRWTSTSSSGWTQRRWPV